MFLLASDPFFRTGLHRNTHCGTEKAAEHDKGLCYQRAAQELMGMTAGKVTKRQRMLLFGIKSQSRGEDEELVLPLTHPFTTGILKGSLPSSLPPKLLLSRETLLFEEGNFMSSL